MHDPRHMPVMRHRTCWPRPAATTAPDRKPQRPPQPGRASATSWPTTSSSPRHPQRGDGVGRDPGGDGVPGAPRPHPRAPVQPAGRARARTTHCRRASPRSCPSTPASPASSSTRSSPSTTSSRAGTRRPACRPRRPCASSTSRPTSGRAPPSGTGPRASFDDLVRLLPAARGGNGEAQRFEVDDQLELRRLLHGEVGRFRALEDPVHVVRGRDGTCPG